MRWWWLSTARLTGAVATDDWDVVRIAPPILKKFIGQPARNLGDWLRGQEGFRVKELK